MQELLSFKTAQFQLTIKCKGVSKRQQAHQTTLVKRASADQHGQQDLLDYAEDRQSLIRFTPALSISDVLIDNKDVVIEERPITQLKLGTLLI